MKFTFAPAVAEGDAGNLTAVTEPLGIFPRIIGNSRIISPAGGSWDVFFAGPPVSDDFMITREQPESQERDPF